MIDMKDEKILIGRSKTGADIELSLKDPLRLGLLGASGSGKSVLLLNILLQLCRTLHERIQLVCFDPKLSSLLPMERRCTISIVSEPADFLPTMQRVEQLLLDRLAEMRKRGLSKIDPLRDGEEFPQILCVLEECVSISNNPDIPKSAQAAIREWYMTYLSRARAANMGAICVSHSFAADVCMPTVARSQLQQRILMKAGIQETKMMAEGMEECCPAWLIPTAGEFYFSDGDYSKWVKGKTWMTADEKAAELANAYSCDKRDVGLSWSVDSPFEE